MIIIVDQWKTLQRVSQYIYIYIKSNIDPPHINQNHQYSSTCPCPCPTRLSTFVLALASTIITNNCFSLNNKQSSPPSLGESISSLEAEDDYHVTDLILSCVFAKAIVLI